MSPALSATPADSVSSAQQDRESARPDQALAQRVDDRPPLDQSRLQEIQAQLRDIHPGPNPDSAPDPRLLAWGWMLISLLVIFVISMLGKAFWRQRRWARQLDWQTADLVPRLQGVLREAALARWPEARPLQGDAWLAWLDAKGGSHFAVLAPHWSGWLYGERQPDERQRAALRRAYLQWGRRCVSRPGRLPRSLAPRRGGGTR